MEDQMHTIGKATSPIFADPVTYTLLKHSVEYSVRSASVVLESCTEAIFHAYCKSLSTNVYHDTSIATIAVKDTSCYEITLKKCLSHLLIKLVFRHHQ